MTGILVVDGSALAEVVLRSERAASVEAVFEGHDLFAPDLVDAEVLSVVRGLLFRSQIDRTVAERAVANLANAPVRRLTTRPLVAEIWTLHRNVTPYDACYLVLARRLDASLLTLDRRLTRAPGLGVTVVTA